jgi:hypothetical protein
MLITLWDKDFYSLIVNNWHCRSPVSGVADLQKVCLGRWDMTKCWIQWNCVLLTVNEMRAHSEVKDIEEAFIFSLAMVSNYLLGNGIITDTKYEDQ